MFSNYMITYYVFSNYMIAYYVLIESYILSCLLKVLIFSSGDMKHHFSFPVPHPLEVLFHYYPHMHRWPKDTPLPTPTHRYNAWADDHKSLEITPRSQEEKGREQDAPELKEEWEEEQKVMCIIVHC